MHWQGERYVSEGCVGLMFFEPSRAQAADAKI